MRGRTCPEKLRSGRKKIRIRSQPSSLPLAAECASQMSAASSKSCFDWSIFDASVLLQNRVLSPWDSNVIGHFQTLVRFYLGKDMRQSNHQNTERPRRYSGNQTMKRERARRRRFELGGVNFWTKIILLISCTKLSSGVYPSSPSLKGTSLGATPQGDAQQRDEPKQYQTQSSPQIHHKEEPSPSPVAKPVIDSESQTSSSSPGTTMNTSPTPIQTTKIKNPPSLPTLNAPQRIVRQTNSRYHPKVNARRQSNGQSSHHHTAVGEAHNDIFLRWCHTVLGITGPVTIQQFDYEDHLSQWISDHEIDFDDDDDDDRKDSFTAPPTRTVRGLAATRDIAVGEVVLSVPYHALLSIENTIDHDPVLSKIMGPEAREKYNWDLESESSISHNSPSDREVEESDLDSSLKEEDLENHLSTSNGDDSTPNSNEIALLIVALLYHLDLGPELSPIWHYIESLLEAECDETMPFLYDAIRLREEFGDTPKIRTLSRDIRRDVKFMYERVMKVLIKDHKDIFGPPTEKGENFSESETNVWMFSFEKFLWGFAMVNSRHWHLPVPELNLSSQSQNASAVPAHHLDQSNSVPIAPPAQQPTEEFISLQDEATKMEHIEEYPDQPLANETSQTLKQDVNEMITRYSFMVPLADMMNFGPPCTRGKFNTETKAFEVIATCAFQEGQEITFWYSDDCDDDMIANYGFTHPMIQSCPTLEDWKYRSDMWKEYAQSLELSLDEAYEDHFITLQDLQSCDCKGSSDESSGKRQRVTKNRKANSRSKQVDL